MFNVTIIKLKDIIKIGIILILIYVFSNCILKNFKAKSILNTTFSFDSVGFIKRGIENQSNIIKKFTNENDRKSNEEIVLKNKDLFDIKTILNNASNIFSQKQMEKTDGQDEIKTAEDGKENR